MNGICVTRVKRQRGVRGQGKERTRTRATIRKGRRQGKTGSVANKRKEESPIGGFSSVGEKNGEGVVGEEEETEGKAAGRGRSWFVIFSWKNWVKSCVTAEVGAGGGRRV